MEITVEMFVLATAAGSRVVGQRVFTHNKKGAFSLIRNTESLEEKSG